jgi:hypothetical protein
MNIRNHHKNLANSALNEAVFGFLDEAEFWGEIPSRPSGASRWVDINDVPADATLGLGRMWNGFRCSEAEDGPKTKDGYYGELEHDDIVLESAEESLDSFWDENRESPCSGLDYEEFDGRGEPVTDVLLNDAFRQKARVADVRASRCGETHHSKKRRPAHVRFAA